MVFWQVRNFDFINYDDGYYVTENRNVLRGLSLDNIVWAFTTGSAANWHPLTWLSLMLDCELFGPNAGWMHLINVLLHIANTLLLFAVLRKMSDSIWPSAFVAATFALHPMHVESVAWIAERKDVLSMLFWMLTLAAYLRYVKRPCVFRYIATVVIFVLGLMAKPMLVTLPFVLLLLDYWPLDRFVLEMAKTSVCKTGRSAPSAKNHPNLKRVILEKIPFFAFSAISSVITFLVQRSSGATADIHALSLKARLANAFLSYIRYIGKMFWPQNLAVFYPFDAGSTVFWQVILCVLSLLIISVLVIRFGRCHKYLPAGWFWFIGTLIPVIGLVWVGGQAMADRYTYIPYIGLFIMIAWGLSELLSKWPYRKSVVGISMVIVLTALGLRSHRQVSYWSNSSTLFSHALEITKNNYVAYFNLANDLLKQGDTARAIEYYEKTLEIKPKYGYAHNNLGLVLGKQGKLAEAFAHFTQALQLMPDFANARNNLANVLILQGRFDEAIDQLHTLLKDNPDFADAHSNLGLALREQGRLSEAGAQFAQAVQLMPDFVNARSNLASVLLLQGRLDEALDQLRAILKLEPQRPDVMNDLAWYMATHPELKSRDVNEAIRLAHRACELTNYNNSAFLGTLAAAYAAAGRFPEAIDTARTALKLADAANQPQVKSIVQRHLTFYTQGKPYIEPPPKTQ